MKMKVVDTIKRMSDKNIATIIGTIVLSHTLRELQREIEIDYKPTNADRIRAMSDEELETVIMCPNQNGLAEIECNYSDGCNCYECCKDWLRSETEEQHERQIFIQSKA